MLALRRLASETVSMTYKAIGAAIISEIATILHHWWMMGS